MTISPSSRRINGHLIYSHFMHSHLMHSHFMHSHFMHSHLMHKISFQQKSPGKYYSFFSIFTADVNA